MNMVEVIPFEFEGKAYEIQVKSDGATIYIRAFHEGKPANGFSYQVNLTEQFDLKKLIGFDTILYFIKSAKEDVLKKRWEEFLEAMSRNNR